MKNVSTLLVGLVASGLVVVGCAAPNENESDAVADTASAFSSGGDHIAVTGKLFAPAGADCNSAVTNLKMTIRYKNNSLPWGVSLTLHRGISGGSTYCPGDGFPCTSETYHWRNVKDEAMPPVAPWTWEASTDVTSQEFNDTVGGVDFVVRIAYPDGHVEWDTAGKHFGYYSADVFAPTFDQCGPTPPGEKKRVRLCDAQGNCQLRRSDIPS
jgi:hypothetical protein